MLSALYDNGNNRGRLVGPPRFASVPIPKFVRAAGIAGIKPGDDHNVLETLKKPSCADLIRASRPRS